MAERTFGLLEHRNKASRLRNGCLSVVEVGYARSEWRKQREPGGMTERWGVEVGGAGSSRLRAGNTPPAKERALVRASTHAMAGYMAGGQ